MNLHMKLHSFPSPFLHFHTITLLPCKAIVNLPSRSRNRFSFPRQRCNAPNFKIVRSSTEKNEVKLLEAEEAELLLATCVTRTLPPALTLESGLEMIRDSVEELKSKPRAKAGMYRFQIGVSPGSSALSWFCSQNPSLEGSVFPQFFVSRGVEKPTNKSLSFSQTHGVAGFGAAVFIKPPLCSSSIDDISFRRFPSVDSAHLMAYGLFGHSRKYENISLYMFIPQIELVDSDGLSILTATIAWNNSSHYEEAFDVIMYLTTALTRPLGKEHLNISVNAVLKKFNMVEDKHAQMVYADALLLKDGFLDHMELENASSSSSQFYLRLSPTEAVCNNMLDQFRDITNSLKESSNMNTLWASLIIEECYRLGLTYFCIAPGSRSTPLAIAATSHPMTNCIACFDERSLAFHAIGYAKSSHMPAVVITSSGTAVSNLLPAVVEASQDFLPLLLLTADRPPELLDTGANQAINQVNIFGTFVRHFLNLPVPTDDISARMVLTTFDSAVHHATSSSYGPVHINCPFREPLENTPKEWSRSCLKGLEFWASSGKPFTSYFQPRISFTHGDVADVLGIIKEAKRGILVIGAMFKEDDIWAALLLASHLQWPVFADILSGLRLRKYKNSISKINERILFVDHLDHMLLSADVKQWINPDVILQIGSRITSKQVSQMLEDCSTCPYILVDNHPSRHDPSHIITHRIQSNVTQFTDFVLRSCTTKINRQWTSFLRSVNTMVEWEISFLINSENSLSEPYVAHVTSEAIEFGSAMFIGNSMPIRDADMYGSSQGGEITKLTSGFPFSWIQVAGNRGASGIDGLLSTAVGFAVGHNKKVVCVIGDVSFLHDTNGLALLKQRISRKQMTILVINNHGGAIFSLLPVANKAEEKILNRYFYTSHDIGIHNLCIAHGVKHVHVSTKSELHDAVLNCQKQEADCVIEVESSIDANKNFHGYLRQFACQAAGHAFSIISQLPMSVKVHKLEFFQYRIQLNAPLTSNPIGDDNDNSMYYRQGFVVTLYLEDGSTGIGEVAPLGIHKGNLADVHEQLQFVSHVIKGASLHSSLPLLNGSFSSWIWTTLGIPPDSLLPSVRCGLEMAILNAIASTQGSTMLNILHPSSPKEEPPQKSSNITICALLDSNGTPKQLAYLATKLVQEGFTAIKLKVARRESPIEDAHVIQEIRKKVGYHIQLRADANKKWSFNEAIQFSSNVKDCGLEYVEEPVNNENDIIRFCEESGLPVALDETIDNLPENPLQILARFTHEKIVAVVIKPSFVGGFEKAAFIARWAHQHGKMAVVSAAFESGISLSAYVQFSYFLKMQNNNIRKIMNEELPVSDVAHGLGTYKWLKEDVITNSFSIRGSQASVFDAGQTLTNFNINQNSVTKTFQYYKVRNYEVKVNVNGITFSINVKELGDKTNDKVIVFVHGFLGTSDDWIPIMSAMSASSRCIAVDLPGHGCSKMHANNNDTHISMEIVAEMLQKLFLVLTTRKVTVVGYSMGARIALYMSLKCNNMVKGIVMISGSPGLDNEFKRKARCVKDDSLACALVSYGLDLFIQTWYSGDMWQSLKSHPQFDRIVGERLKHDDVAGLAKALCGLSTGRQPSLWEDLKAAKSHVVVIVGERDEKFKKIGENMCKKIGEQGRVVEIPNCGHAVHVENPLRVIDAITQFITRLDS
ncbi:hypothetical protein LXL04_011139 [Taraxacum kok-saghyz]